MISVFPLRGSSSPDWNGIARIPIMCRSAGTPHWRRRTMTAIIFAGPSLPPSLAPLFPALEWRPPLTQGDLFRAATERPALIGVVDAYFERVATVWHKEILWAMAEGIHVYGAASIGALRAAELAAFGMQGVGVIFEQYRSSALIDDDDVALQHGPADLDYVQLTEAMVNVRATIDHAADLGIIGSALAANLLGIAKSLFYKERTFSTILSFARQTGASSAGLDNFAAWLPAGRVDQKRFDALALARTMTEHLERGVSPLKVTYSMAHTFAWEIVRRRHIPVC